MKKIKIFLRNHVESISVILFSLVISLTICIFFNDTYIALYNESKINLVLIELFGGLLGLLLTAYAVLFGLIPSFNKDFLDSSTFDRLNKRFVYTILSNLFLLVMSIILNFVNLFDYIPILFLHLFLMIFSFSMILLLTIYLYFIFKIAKRKKLEN